MTAVRVPVECVLDLAPRRVLIEDRLEDASLPQQDQVMDIEDLLLGQLFLQPGYDFWPHAGLFTQPLEEVPTRVGFIHHAWLWALAALLWGMCVQLNSMQDHVHRLQHLLQAQCALVGYHTPHTRRFGYNSFSVTTATNMFIYASQATSQP